MAGQGWAVGAAFSVPSCQVYGGSWAVRVSAQNPKGEGTSAGGPVLSSGMLKGDVELASQGTWSWQGARGKEGRRRGTV